MKQKNLLIFDSYGTLISTGNGSIEAVKKILALQDKDIDAKEFYKEWKKFHRDHMDLANVQMFVSEKEIFSWDLRELYRLYGIKRPYQNDVKIMLSSLTGRKVFEDVKSVLSKLRETHRVVIGSTTDTEPLIENLKANNIEVNAIYTSELIGKYKPDSEFYRYILEQESCEAEDAVFIGDSLLDDVWGPKQSGITTVLIDRMKKYHKDNAETIPDYVIREFNELLNLNL